MPAFRAVIFDLGGVVIDSPLHAIGRYERELGIPAGTVNRVVVETGPRDGAVPQLEERQRFRVDRDDPEQRARLEALQDPGRLLAEARQSDRRQLRLGLLLGIVHDGLHRPVRARD